MAKCKECGTKQTGFGGNRGKWSGGWIHADRWTCGACASRIAAEERAEKKAK